MANHNFNFEGGEILRTIGATWLVSYAYYDHVDKTHTNWNEVKTTSQRISRYERSREHHTNWLRHERYQSRQEQHWSYSGTSEENGPRGTRGHRLTHPLRDRTKPKQS